MQQQWGSTDLSMFRTWPSDNQHTLSTQAKQYKNMAQVGQLTPVVPDRLHTCES